MQNTNDGVLISTPKIKKRVNMSHQVKERRRRVIKRLEDQLKSGKKICKSPLENGSLYTSLEEKDINRIKKEIETLKGRI